MAPHGHGGAREEEVGEVGRVEGKGLLEDAVGVELDDDVVGAARRAAKRRLERCEDGGDAESGAN